MAKKGDIFLGLLGDEILLSPFGRTTRIDLTELSRQDRTASGKLVKDIIAKKHKITLEYSMIDGDELKKLLDIYDLDSELSLNIYNVTEEVTTTPAPEENYDHYTVLMQPFDKTLVLLQDNGLWSGVSVVLDEV